ncbi:alpha/beta fold hydrolase [Streptomyces sp. SID13666]|uniref:alpha/beta fold hydrolase n=1 Tax=unclassified Streptomyces TaxID=2593676 RepID=UPI0013C0E9B6|nr:MULTISPECIES: alpha/beta fold hydrolase [unclassified Streptomyces]NEA53383.1 alpha/beta fold hydrolase [Streptomyces sp. SID13666]NEA69290.1 alpha/beta fold hydrolase [Streptomyces sp. SID13588]
MPRQAGNLGAPPGGGGGQEIRFCRAPDGVRLAYATHGQGPPLVIDACWLSHLQFDWQSPVWRHFLKDLGALFTVIRFDERGYGLSDWEIEDYSLEARVADLEAVVEAAGLDRFALVGMSQGGPVAITYTAGRPDRVTRLILSGTWASAARTPEDVELLETLVSMIRVGWARPDSLFRRVFTNMLIPGASEEQMRWVDALQRMSTSTENAAALCAERQKVDVNDLLPAVAAPTLVLHSRDDAMAGFDEARIIASSIPGARLVPLESRNHILLADEPAWHVFLQEVAAFAEPDREAVPATVSPAPLPNLTEREFEVLRLAAAGLDNSGIAGSLALSVRTVERHLSNAYLKLGVSGRAGRTAAVADLVRRGLA